MADWTREENSGGANSSGGNDGNYSLADTEEYTPRIEAADDATKTKMILELLQDKTHEEIQAFLDEFAPEQAEGEGEPTPAMPMRPNMGADTGPRMI